MNFTVVVIVIVVVVVVVVVVVAVVLLYSILFYFISGVGGKLENGPKSAGAMLISIFCLVLP